MKEVAISIWQHRTIVARRRRPYSAKQYEEVLRRMTLVLEADPAVAPAYWYRGMDYYYLENYPVAFKEMELDCVARVGQAIDLQPDFWPGYAARGTCAVALGDSTALAFGEIPAAYKGRGDAYRGWQRYGEAVDNYLSALQLIPDYVEVYGHLADAYLQQRQYEEAVTAANRFLELDPGNVNKPLVLESRGRAYYSLGDHKRAIDDLTQAMARYPTALGYYYRGLAYQANGQDRQAMADLEFFLAHVSNLYPDEIDDARVRLAALKQ